MSEPNIRKSFRCVIVDPSTNAPLCTGIQIKVPSGLTRHEAVSYVAGEIAKEVGRYAAWEALGFGPVTKDMDWYEVVT